MGLPITAGCDTAWHRTRVSVVAPQAMRCCALDRSATRQANLFVLPKCTLNKATQQWQGHTIQYNVLLYLLNLANADNTS